MSEGYIPLNKVIVKHMFRFCAKKMRALFKDRDHLMRKKDNCMWYYNIEHSLHMHVLQTNCWDEYLEYLEVTTQKEHSQATFEALRDSFDINKVEPIDVWWSSADNAFIVDNGVHRLALMKHLGYVKETIPLRLLKIRIPAGEQKKIGDALRSTVGGAGMYNGWTNRTSYGYHSFDIGDLHLVGQRVPKDRLGVMRKAYSFAGKKVLDLGCNTGGMLFHCSEMDEGIGLEYDERCVVAAKTIGASLGFLPPTTVIQANLESDTIQSKLPEGWTPDCVFLLSMGSWLKQWWVVYQQVLDMKPGAIWLETNNNHEGEPQLEFFAKQEGWAIEKISRESRDDTTGNYGRALYLLTRIE